MQCFLPTVGSSLVGQNGGPKVLVDVQKVAVEEVHWVEDEQKDDDVDEDPEVKVEDRALEDDAATKCCSSRRPRPRRERRREGRCGTPSP